MLHAKFQNHRLSGSVERFLKVFVIYSHGPWRPSWSCDLDHLYKAKKKICLFPVTSPNFFGSVGRKTFLFYSFFFFF